MIMRNKCEDWVDIELPEWDDTELPEWIFPPLPQWDDSIGETSVTNTKNKEKTKRKQS